MAVLLLGVGWSFRSLLGEDLTNVTPVNTAAPYAAYSEQSKATRFMSGLDQRFVIWVMARNARTWLTRPFAMFDAEICYPAPQSLALGEPVLTLGLLATPAWLLHGDPIFVYNFVVLVMPMLAGLAMFLLIRDWTGNAAAALTAAVLYAFSVVKIADVVHPYITDTAWTLFAFYFFRRWLVVGRWRDVLGLALACSLQIGGSLYALTGAALIGALIAVYGAYRIGLRATRPTQWATLVLICLVVLYGAFAPFLAKSLSGALAERSIQAFLAWSAIMPGQTGWPGWLTLGLCGIAFVPALRLASETTWSPRWPLLVGAIFVLLLATGGNAGDRLAAELANQPPPPALPNPYEWLSLIVPGLSSIRAPLWIATSFHMGLCVLAGLGAARLLGWLPMRSVAVASVGLVVIAFVVTLRPGFTDSHGYSTQAMRPPERLMDFYRSLDDLGDRGPLLELPVDNLGLSLGSMSILMAAYHERPTSRCYNSFFPPEVQSSWELAKELPDEAVVGALFDLGFRTLVIHHSPSRRAMLQLIEQIDQGRDQPGAALEFLHGDPEATAYRIVGRRGGSEGTEVQ
jgi:hypothetical protein